MRSITTDKLMAELLEGSIDNGGACAAHQVQVEMEVMEADEPEA